MNKKWKEWPWRNKNVQEKDNNGEEKGSIDKKIIVVGKDKNEQMQATGLEWIRKMIRKGWWYQTRIESERMRIE